MTSSDLENSAVGLRGLSETGAFVDQRVSSLQRMHLMRSPYAAATLARLRRAVGKEPGSVPDVWEVTLDGAPVGVGYTSDEPSWSERAAHTALTLYAVHQQARSEPMHARGRGFGTAARQLATATGAVEAVARRFHAVGTATEFAEVAYHARSMVTQLRGASIPLDYGVLADQFVALQRPGSIARVRLVWGREFHRVDKDGRLAEPATPSTSGARS